MEYYEDENFLGIDNEEDLDFARDNDEISDSEEAFLIGYYMEA